MKKSRWGKADLECYNLIGSLMKPDEEHQERKEKWKNLEKVGCDRTKGSLKNGICKIREDDRLRKDLREDGRFRTMRDCSEFKMFRTSYQGLKALFLKFPTERWTLIFNF